MFGIPYDASQFYPSDLLDEYRSIPVQAGGAHVTVRVNNYRNARNPPEKGGTQSAESVKDGLLNVSKNQIIREAGGAAPLVDVFTGKASPGDIGTVLGLVYKYKDDFIKAFGKSGGFKEECAKLLQSHHSPQAMMQAFCDAYVGLDCNGFVGNFAKRIKARLGPQNGPKQYYDQRKATRRSMDDMENLDVVVWADFSHIAVVDSFDGTLTKVLIAQSTGGGPQITWHGLVPAGNGQFQLAPPSKVGGTVHVLFMGW